MLVQPGTMGHGSPAPAFPVAATPHSGRLFPVRILSLFHHPNGLDDNLWQGHTIQLSAVYSF